MKFSKSLDWLKESDEENLLGDDELDVVDEELNEGLYVDPANYDKHSDLVDVVDKAGNPQKMTQDTYNKNKDSGEFKDAEPKEKEQIQQKVRAGSKVDARDIKAGNSYVTKEDMYYGDLDEFEGIYDGDKLKKLGFVNDNNEIVIPAGTELKYQGFNGGAETFDINGEEFDLSLDDIDLYEAEKEEPKKEQSTKSKGILSKEDYDKMSPRDATKFLLKQSKANRQPINKQHVDQLNKLLSRISNINSGAEIINGPLKSYMLKNDIKVKDLIPYIDDEARTRMNYAFRQSNKPAGDERLVDIFSGWYHTNDKAHDVENNRKLMKDLCIEDYLSD